MPVGHWETLSNVHVHVYSPGISEVTMYILTKSPLSHPTNNSVSSLLVEHTQTCNVPVSNTILRERENCKFPREWADLLATFVHLLSYKEKMN